MLYVLMGSGPEKGGLEGRGKGEGGEGGGREGGREGGGGREGDQQLQACNIICKCYIRLVNYVSASIRCLCISKYTACM